VEDEIPEVATSVSTQEKRNIKKAVTFGKTPARTTCDSTKKKFSKPRKKQTPALDSGDYEVLVSSQLHYTVLARQERETGELTLWLGPKAHLLAIPKERRVPARTPTSPKKVGIAYVSTFPSIPRDTSGYTEFRYARASPTVQGKINGHRIPMLINGGSEICVMSEDVARELNI
jgi:hypothetical protein